jgi:RNA polymerase sigma-70 factor (ECF subfamily)
MGASHYQAACGDPVQIAENRLTQEQLWLAMQRLTGDQARVMTLRFLEGLSISEVASVMNRSEGSVKVAWQYRAAVALRRLLSSPSDRELCDEVPTRAARDEYSPWRHRTMLPAGA